MISYQRAPRITSRPMEGEDHMVYDPVAGTVHIVNGPTAFVLEELSQKMTLAHLVRRCVSEFLVDSESAQRDLEAILARLESLGLIVTSREKYGQKEIQPGGSCSGGEPALIRGETNVLCLSLKRSSAHGGSCSTYTSSSGCGIV